MRSGDLSDDRRNWGSNGRRENVKYKIKEFSNMIGIEVSKIRYYEKKGVIRHQREENGYRIFNEQDAFYINDFIAINSRGYSIAESTQLLKGQPLQEAIDGLVNNASEMEMQIAILEEKKRYALETALLFRLLRENRHGIYRTTLPSYIIHPASDHGDFELTQKNARIRSQWQKLIPYTRYVGFGDSSQILSEKTMVDCGHAVREDHFQALHYPVDETIKEYPLGDCICFYVEAQEDETINVSFNSHVIKYLEEHNLSIVGDFLLFYFMMPIHEFGKDAGMLVLPVSASC